MVHQARPTTLLARIIRLAALLALLLAWTFGCAPASPEEAPHPVVSLLPVTPYIGDETEFRDPAPQPTRLVMGEESVQGWMSPPEGMLRFPVDLRRGAHLALRLTGIGQIPRDGRGLSIRVEHSRGSPTAREDNALSVVFEATPVQVAACFHGWYPLDIELDRCSPGQGELRFVLDGPLAGIADIDLMWGHPAIYYPRERRGRNVLLIGIDTLRADALSPYGARLDATPNLQELSESAGTFTQARSQSSWTLPSFASMMTGRLPSSIGATVYSLHMPDRAITLGEMLLPQGFATQTICSNTLLGNNQSGFHQGMEGLWFRFDASPQELVRETREFISRSLLRDWFCFLHVMDPHDPFTPPDELAERFCDPAYDGPIGSSFRWTEEWKTGDFNPPEEDLRQVRNLYNAEVANLDAALGELFAFLEENDLIEETLIIFASDHGEEFLDHGGFEHGHTHFDEMVWLPLILRGDGFPPGERFDDCVGNIDIVPTILRYLDLPVPAELPGVPLQDVVGGKVANDRAGAPAFQPARVIFGEGNNRGAHRKFAVEWPYKCILDFTTAETRLYNLAVDPGETQDISESHPEVAERLSHEMVSAMLPEQNTWHIWITGGHGDSPHVFTGTLRVPGGFRCVQSFNLTQTDNYAVHEDRILFSVTSSVSELGLLKHLIITPNPGADTLEASVQVDGRVDPERFFPYGSRTPEPSGSATVLLGDFPLGAHLPLSMQGYPAACYLWGLRGIESEEDRAELDAETRAQLRALGYIN